MNRYNRDIGSRVARRILVIDDEERMAQSLKLLLESSGYQVETAPGGYVGLEKLRKEDFPVVITDLRMAEGDGYEVMRALADQPDRAFIVITGHASTESAIEALQRRAFDYITKPFEFDVLKTAVERAFARLEADRFRDDMVSMITHDVKIPLSSILGYSGMIFDSKTGQLHPRAPDFVKTIRANGAKMLSLLDNFLTSCKIEAGKLTLYFRPVNLHHILTDALSLFEAEMQRNEQELATDLSADPARVEGDESLLYRAFCNLVSNACKYTPRGGRISVASKNLAAEESQLGLPAVQISFTNTGPGIPQEELRFILEKFTRSRSHRGIDGTGIGSHVFRYVIEAHGGHVEVMSVPNELTSFHVLLPVHQSRPSEDS